MSNRTFVFWFWIVSKISLQWTFQTWKEASQRTDCNICKGHLHQYNRSRMFGILCSMWTYSSKQVPRIKTISVRQVLRRIVGKAIGWILYSDILNATGPLPASAGLEAGADGANHVVKKLCQQDSIEYIILVDASNAYSSLN